MKLSASFDDRQSLAFRLRTRRMAFFMDLLAVLDGPVKLLDVGGTVRFWRTLTPFPNGEVRITLLNQRDPGEKGPFLETLVGDARCLPFGDKSFDVVFSNSVIEHVGTFEDQARMAAEVQRVGRRYFVQTPNKFFPIEPHFFFPFFQFLPLGLRAWLLSHVPLGRSRKIRLPPEKAGERAASIRLLDQREVCDLFPDASLYKERFCGLVKSFTAYGGWETG